MILNRLGIKQSPVKRLMLGCEKTKPTINARRKTGRWITVLLGYGNFDFGRRAAVCR
jgi:hypothetical protein